MVGVGNFVDGGRLFVPNFLSKRSREHGVPGSHLIFPELDAMSPDFRPRPSKQSHHRSSNMRAATSCNKLQESLKSINWMSAEGLSRSTPAARCQARYQVIRPWPRTSNLSMD